MREGREEGGERGYAEGKESEWEVREMLARRVRKRGWG